MNWSRIFPPHKAWLEYALLPLAAAALCYRASPAIYVIQQSTNWIHDPWNVIPDPANGDTVVYVGMTTGPCTGGRCADFDTIMRNFLVTNTHVFIGPGTFSTKGVWNDDYGQSDSNGFFIRYERF
jgi:hypothetical protein